MSLFDSLIAEKNISQAITYLKNGKDTCGLDGIRVSQIDEYWSLNNNNIIAMLRNNSYFPGDVLINDIVTRKGKKRTIAKINTVDKLVSRMIFQIIDDVFELTVSSNSFAYQKNRGVFLAVTAMKEYIELGYDYILSVDIKDFFENINHNILLEEVKHYISDDNILTLINKFLKVRIIHNFKYSIKNKGLLQGSILSPLLSNIYLNNIDKYFENNNIKYIRYADDIRIFAKSYNDIIKYQNIFEEMLNQLDLKINPTKTKISSIKEGIPKYLGYDFIRIKDSNKIEIKKINHNTNYQSYLYWTESSIERINDEYHIINDGILNQNDYNVLFENEEKRVIIPINSFNSLNIYSNVIISKNFLNLMNEHKINVSFYDKHSDYVGSFIPASVIRTSSLSVAQLENYIDPNSRLYIAKQFVLSSAHNIRENLKYYFNKTKKQILKENAQKITKLIDKENKCNNYNVLLSLEGQVRIIYYSCINDILNNDSFDYKSRNRRPPKDPINALISYGNTLLYRLIARKIYLSKLDIKIGFLHATNSRIESLNLDISEIFKPIIVDRVIFSLIKRHEIKEDKHFEQLDNGAVYLNEEGRRIFIRAFEEKIMSKLKIDNKYYSYSELITNEIIKLSNHMLKIKEYKAYKYFL